MEFFCPLGVTRRSKLLQQQFLAYFIHYRVVLFSREIEDVGVTHKEKNQPIQKSFMTILQYCPGTTKLNVSLEQLELL